MPMYTAILLYPESMTGDYGADIYVNSAEADDPYKATRLVQEMCMQGNAQTIESVDELRPIAVMEGEIQLVLDATCFPIKPEPSTQNAPEKSITYPLKLDKQIEFHGYDCDIYIYEYESNRQQKAIELMVADTPRNHNRSASPGEPMGMATACIPSYNAMGNWTAIRDYGEMTGIYQVLLDAGIISTQIVRVHTGFVELPIVRILQL